MNIPNFETIRKSTTAFLTEHSSAIMVTIGLAGMGTAIVMSAEATPKAMLLIEEEKKAKQVDNLTPVETVKTVWKCYAPTAAVAVLSSACIIGANKVDARKRAALATAYSLSEEALREYHDKTVEMIGEKKEQAIRDSIDKDHVDRKPPVNTEVIITERGNTLCLDSMTGRYFKSDIDELRRIENELNRMILNEGYISLNDYYYEIGLDATEVGEELGWNVDKGYMSLSFSSQLTKDQTPCLVVSFGNRPVMKYYAMND